MRKRGGSSDVGTSVAFGRAKRCRRETSIDIGGGQMLRRREEVKEKRDSSHEGRAMENRTSLRGLRSE